MSNNQNQGASIEAERELFEAEIRKLNPKLLFVERWPDGSYKHHGTDGRWHGWQMARRSVPPAAVGDLPPLHADMLTRFWDIAGAEWMATGKSQSLLYAEKIVTYAIATDRAQRKQAALQEISDIGQEIDAGAAPASAQPAEIEVQVLPVEWAPGHPAIHPAMLQAGAQPDQRESAADAKAILERAADMLEGYAKYCYRVKPAEIEEHPYIPSIEEAAEELRALAGAASPAAQPVAKDGQHGKPVFNILPTLTPEKEAMAKGGLCPSCGSALKSVNRAEGMHFLQCTNCRDITVLKDEGQDSANNSAEGEKND